MFRLSSNHCASSRFQTNILTKVHPHPIGGLSPTNDDDVLLYFSFVPSVLFYLSWTHHFYSFSEAYDFVHLLSGFCDITLFDKFSKEHSTNNLHHQEVNL